MCVSGDMLFFMRSRISARGGFRDGKVCVEVDSGMITCVGGIGLEIYFMVGDVEF